MKKSLLALACGLAIALSAISTPARASGSPVPEPVMWLLMPLFFIASLFESDQPPDKGQYIPITNPELMDPADRPADWKASAPGAAASATKPTNAPSAPKD